VLWTCGAPPLAAREAWFERGDKYIGLLELVAILLCMHTFRDLLEHTSATLYIDNDGVLGGMLRGSLKAPDSNWALGKLWLEIALWDIDVTLGRVESKANLADGPTRGRLRGLPVGAEYRAPVWPSWMTDWWSAPEA